MRLELHLQGFRGDLLRVLEDVQDLMRQGRDRLPGVAAAVAVVQVQDALEVVVFPQVVAQSGEAHGDGLAGRLDELVQGIEDAGGGGGLPRLGEYPVEVGSLSAGVYRQAAGRDGAGRLAMGSIPESSQSGTGVAGADGRRRDLGGDSGQARAGPRGGWEPRCG